MSSRKKLHNYTITLAAKGPVFVGSGQTVSKKDTLWLYKEDKVYILDPKKMYNGLKEKGLLPEYQKYLLDHKQKNFIDFINNNSDKLDLRICKSWAAYTVSGELGRINSAKGKRNMYNIDTFMKDPYGCPYIPGSSLKGALRTVITGARIISDRGRFSDKKYKIETEKMIKRERKKYLLHTERGISQSLFYTLKRDREKLHNAVNDVFSGMRISDSKPLSTDDLIICGKYDVNTNGEGKSLPLRRECIKPGTKIEFTMEIDEEMMQISGDEILSCTDMFYADYYDGFLSAFPKIDNTNGTEGHVLLIGGGAGYASKTTVYPLYDKFDSEGNKSNDDAVKAVQNVMVNTAGFHKHGNDLAYHGVSPRVRKCAKIGSDVYDMGLCEIEIVDKG